MQRRVDLRVEQCKWRVNSSQTVKQNCQKELEIPGPLVYDLSSLCKYCKKGPSTLLHAGAFDLFRTYHITGGNVSGMKEPGLHKGI